MYSRRTTPKEWINKFIDHPLVIIIIAIIAIIAVLIIAGMPDYEERVTAPPGYGLLFPAGGGPPVPHITPLHSTTPHITARGKHEKPFRA